MADLLIERAEVDGILVDVHIRGDHVVDVLPSTTRHRAGGRRTNPFDAHGGVVVPGLHDHHIHLAALAARASTVELDDIKSPTELAPRLDAAHQSLPVGAWLRATGYSEHALGSLTREHLDALIPGRPVRVQHRGGQLWVLNSRALDLTGAQFADLTGVERGEHGRATGRLFGLDAWQRDRVPALELDFAAVGAQLLRFGITGVTDLTPTEESGDVELLARAATSGALPQRVVVTGGAALAVDAATTLERGPVKIVVADHDLPGTDDLVAAIRLAHGRNRAVAVHCVTREALLLTLAALADAGTRTGDRIEHAAIAPPEAVDDIKRLGLTVVTQPGFVYARGDDYLATVDPRDVGDLWPCRRLLDAGISVAAGSDAPFGPLDPWLAVATAATRRTQHGAIANGDERVSARAALDLYLGSPSDPGTPRTIRPGTTADLCVLGVARRDMEANPHADLVAATVCRGVLTPVG